ncbi:MAG: TatD family hydrolase [Salinivirgaceae bacterium]|jgi:TatD DNase family protein|nr:TatD family hydrolase [Salinivirgaceae bacterium]
MSEFVNIHTHKIEENKWAILNAKWQKPIAEYSFCSIGIHPWDIGNSEIKTALQSIEQCVIDDKKVIAIGEIGIDRAIVTSVEEQMDVFYKQIHLSEKYKLPAIIHCVKAYSDMLGLRKGNDFKMPWIFHGFSGNVTIAKQLINKGCYLSFGEKLLTNNKVQETLLTIPLQNLFFETDDSDEKIENIYKKAAELRHICIEKLKEEIYYNFKKVFGTE